MKKKVIIFGAGTWGKFAYHYYKDSVEIVCFIDNKMDIWETNLEGIRVCSPDVLSIFDLREIKIVIAIKNNWKEIQKQLFTKYNISESILFRIEEETLDFNQYEAYSKPLGQNIIVWYGGGLGNQMFQYALAKCFMKAGNHVSGYIANDSLRSKREFELSSVFPNILLDRCSSPIMVFYERVINLQYKEPVLGKVKFLEADMQILEKTEGIFQGCWQSYKYAEMNKDELLNDFKFKEKKDLKLKKIIDDMSKENAVSVHIRRGDYLKFPELYGNICTDKYYVEALKYINKYVENPVFYFFSNDIDWVMQKYKEIDNAIFVKENMFEEYEDWYDMYLMSYCKHNIIANSTFSWWGAWLNRNTNKIVIAPQKWVNGTVMLDIYPQGWVRI